MICIIMGSESDLKIAEKGVKILKEFGVEFEVRVASAHRTPELVEKIVKTSKAEVFIAIAGLSAHLPGVVASLTTKPVIAVPVEAKLCGLDALLSVVQMPPGIPVASVGIDRGENAVLLALEILALKDKNIEKKLIEYREKMKEKVYASDEKVKEMFK
ncbi:phosphoribosylaminoimidazole carboxylase, catalytic subunit [Methanocaldococcus vulcanius M7]|uniref:N5-carboxyaminoimidazole ribonucleotide mutase n=1 Tax=Methanocaldococcus vulcanius (strain ATCC 700851 / DSM 12094 / M7) TaxID=579137 RepID=C9RHX9_METVM|nr:5-(carboxyamino)imidazole ribonucleotide mutase [Methanocaldococcus vulcanius]ACX73181.1 phosphoribosylaminoimidazole carboxylase, catalytic subunit [Methanocaldococcus vulcanius M7]